MERKFRRIKRNLNELYSTVLKDDEKILCQLFSDGIKEKGMENNFAYSVI